MAEDMLGSGITTYHIRVTVMGRNIDTSAEWPTYFHAVLCKALAAWLEI